MSDRTQGTRNRTRARPTQAGKAAKGNPVIPEGRAGLPPVFTVWSSECRHCQPPSQRPLVSPPNTCPHQPENPSPTGQQSQAGNVGSARLPKHHQPMKSGTENLLVKPMRPPSSPCPCRGRTPLPLRCFLHEPCRHEGFMLWKETFLPPDLNCYSILQPRIFFVTPLCPSMF